MLISAICLYLTLGACAVVAGVIVIKYDLYRREPWGLMLLAVGLGALGMLAAGQAQVLLIRAINAGGREVTNLMMALMAGVTEESAKALVVVILATRPTFDEPLDGLVFGSLAGLGAALDESVHYLGYGAPPEYLPPQEPVRIAGHLVMGGIAGFGIGPWRTRQRHGVAWAAGAFGLAVVLHVAWDIVAFSAADRHRLTGTLSPWHTGLPMVFIVVGMLAYRQLASIGAAMTRRHLGLEGSVAPGITAQAPPKSPG